MKSNLLLHLLLPVFGASFAPYHTKTQWWLSSSSSSHSSSEAITPEEDPNADPTQQSKSGVLYSDVLGGLYKLYPPSDLEKRTAASRTDGYWPFIQQGVDPPKETTYGEYDLFFFAQLLDKALEYSNSEEKDDDDEPVSNKVFCDIGSGTGRLVLAAAALHPGFRQCRGIELLNSIHVVAEETLEKCNPDYAEEKEIAPQSSSLMGESDWLSSFQGQFVLDATDGDDDDDELEEEEADDHATEKSEPAYVLPSETDECLELAPVDFVCGSFDDSSVYFGDANVIFCFSSCMSSSIIERLSKAIGRQCKPGTIVITTEFPLMLEGTIDPLDDPDEEKYAHCTYDGDFDDPDDEQEWIRFCKEEGLESKPFKFELLESIDGYCWITGGNSTAHIHRIVASVGGADGGPPRQETTIEEQAAMAWIYAKKKNPNEFYRDVRNNMVYHGFSPEWYADLVEE